VEAAHHLNVPLSTLRAWCVEQGYPAGMSEKSPNQAGQPKEIERASSKRRRIIAAIACLHPFAGVVATVLTGES
jgi:hypothetical protein